ncbi:MAG: shikimate dehydrogenase [Muribaculaceae bacterium]|nr:shikimate dehydrogenase [Muribaculaceae bacterium]
MNQTEKYGLIGYPLGHSFSQRYFTEKFRKEEIDAIYHPFPIENIGLFPSLLKEVNNLKGLNVTIPYKEKVMGFLDDISDAVKEIGAVNVIRIEERENELYLKGFNSDYIGFRDSLRPLLRPDVSKALILGTGGASKAVEYALRQLGIVSTKVSRKPKKGELSYNDLSEEIISEHLLIVNTTPLGMYPHTDTYPPIPYSFLTSRHICYDLVYNPETTEFMRKSSANGATVKNGLEMLHLQAEEAWKIWQK